MGIPLLANQDLTPILTGPICFSCGVVYEFNSHAMASCLARKNACCILMV